MNETLQQALAVLIQQATSTVDTAKSFLAAEIPEVVHQLLMWNFVSSLLLFLLSITVFSGWAYFIYYVCTEKQIPDETTYTLYVPTFFSGSRKEMTDGGFMVVVGTSIVTWIVVPLSCSFTWLKIWIAPKVWLVEYAASLLK